MGQYCLQNGVLKRMNREGSTGLEAFQVVVPKQETKDVWIYHDRLGHPSVERYLTTLRWCCNWPRMTQDVKEWKDKKKKT